MSWLYTDTFYFSPSDLFDLEVLPGLQVEMCSSETHRSIWQVVYFLKAQGSILSSQQMLDLSESRKRLVLNLPISSGTGTYGEQYLIVTEAHDLVPIMDLYILPLVHKAAIGSMEDLNVALTKAWRQAKESDEIMVKIVKQERFVSEQG